MEERSRLAEAERSKAEREAQRSKAEAEGRAQVLARLGAEARTLQASKAMPLRGHLGQDCQAYVGRAAARVFEERYEVALEKAAEGSNTKLTELAKRFADQFRTTLAFLGDPAPLAEGAELLSRCLAVASDLDVAWVHYSEQVARAEQPFPTDLLLRFGQADLDTTIEQCGAWLSDPTTPDRLAGHIILALGKLGDGGAVDSLLSVLGDPRKAENAACALVDLREPRVAGPVVRAVAHFATKNSSDSRARDYVQARLGGLIAPGSSQHHEVAQIWKAASQDAGKADFGMADVPRVTALLLESALVDAGGDTAMEIASRWITSESYELSLSGVSALAEDPMHPRALPALSALARSHRRLSTSLANPDVIQERDQLRDNTEHRIIALKALSRVAAPGVQDLYEVLRNDDDLTVRETAGALRAG